MNHPTRKTLQNLALELAEGRTTGHRLVHEALERIEDQEGEGARAFLKVSKERALTAAHAFDRLRAVGANPSPFAGIPISVKDLFDISGEPTLAGSKVLAKAPAAGRDATAIGRLKAAGFVVVGRTNMTEFAFSGLGLNPHYGTPLNPYDRAVGRIPGGSSSGAAVSVADNMAAAAIGSDTGGSCRIPAALCGLTGFKPTSSAVSRDGVLPLSTTLDSVGSIANSVECCRIIHLIMSGQSYSPRLVSGEISGLRIAVPQAVALDDLEPYIAALFDQALQRLSSLGAQIKPVPMKIFGEVAELNAKGGFAAPEAFAWHRKLLDAHAEEYDPRVLVRILRGREQTAADYIDLLRGRANFVQRANEALSDFDILAMPTTPMVAPPLAELLSDDAIFSRVNLKMLRNPSLINMMDGCSISLPMHSQGNAPAGLMLSAIGGRENKLFRNSAAIETALGA